MRGHPCCYVVEIAASHGSHNPKVGGSNPPPATNHPQDSKPRPQFQKQDPNGKRSKGAFRRLFHPPFFRPSQTTGENLPGSSRKSGLCPHFLRVLLVARQRSSERGTSRRWSVKRSSRPASGAAAAPGWLVLRHAAITGLPPLLDRVIASYLGGSPFQGFPPRFYSESGEPPQLSSIL